MVKSPKLFFKPCFRVTPPQSRILSLKGFSVFTGSRNSLSKKCAKFRIWSERIFEIFVAPHDQENSSIGVFLDSHT